MFEETDLQAANQRIREFQLARAQLLQFVYQASMFEPEARTLDAFMADGTLSIVDITAERLRRCGIAQDHRVRWKTP
jgi:hypothetical protein